MEPEKDKKGVLSADCSESRYKEDDNGNGIKDAPEIYKKEATKFLFVGQENTQNVWARAKETEEILKDLLGSFNRHKMQYKE